LAAKYPHLSDLVKSTKTRGPIAPLRLWCHLVANRPGVTWYSGIVPKLVVQRRQGYLVTSFTSSPLGWLLTFDNALVEGAVDVSDWLTLDKRAKPATIELPCQWRLTPYLRISAAGSRCSARRPHGRLGFSVPADRVGAALWFAREESFVALGGR